MRNRAWQLFLWVRPWGICILLGLMSFSCATEPVVTHLALDYKVPEKNRPDVDMSSYTVSVSPFTDARDDKLFSTRGRSIMAMREEDSPGKWVANAIRLELERADAKVIQLEAGARPRTGNFISGRVNVLKATPYGLANFGLLSVATGTGYSAHINISVEMLRDGIPILSKEYDIKKKVSSEALDTYLVGATPKKTIPKAFEVSLQEMMQTRILPDVCQALKEL